MNLNKKFIQILLTNLILLLGSSTAGSDLNPKQLIQENDHLKVIEWTSDRHGVYSNLTRVLEWIYCVKTDKNYGLYLNMDGAYGFNGNTFSVLFKPFEDPQIFIKRPHSIIHQTTRYPKDYPIFNAYPTDGIEFFHDLRYVYMEPKLYSDEAGFALFRKRLHPIVLQYLQPVSELQKKIDHISERMNVQDSSFKQKLKIGIHVRCIQHYMGNTSTPDQFLDNLEKDIDQMMATKDNGSTQIFLATLLEPLVERLSAKYDIVFCDIQRSQNVKEDWTMIPHTDPLDIARNAIVDTWCLANCDELWGSSSNMVIFAACLNPNLKIYMLPSLQNYRGA